MQDLHDLAFAATEIFGDGTFGRHEVEPSRRWTLSRPGDMC
jgi:hypothetical protein